MDIRTIILILLALGELCLFLLIFFRHKFSEPSNSEVLDELEAVEQDFDNALTEMHQYMADTNDRLEGVLRPILKRNASRDAREREKEAENQQHSGIVGRDGRPIRILGKGKI